jgi:hypothetical protein
MRIVRHVKYPLFLSDFNETRIFRQIFEIPQTSNFMPIRPVGAKLFHADGQTDRHDEASNKLFSILRTRLKIR